MIALMFFFGIVAYFSSALGHKAILLMVIGQLLVGLPLALIDNADTVLTKNVARSQGTLSEGEEDHLEGICTQLKYKGIANASFLGCFLYLVLPPVFLHGQRTSIGTLVFLLTAGSQAVALRKLSRVREANTSLAASAAEPTSERTSIGQKEPSQSKLQPHVIPTQTTRDAEGFFQKFYSTSRAIYKDRVLLIWVLIIAVTEGWLLFSAVYFQLGALGEWRQWAADSLPSLLMIPIMYYLLSQVASIGGSYFSKWQKDKPNEVVKIRHGKPLETPRARLVAACEILAIMSGVFVLHLVITMFLPHGTSQPAKSFLPGMFSLLFYAVYQFLRGFSSPLLKTTISNRVSQMSLPNPTATLSLATGIGRLFHAVSTVLFTGCLTWVIVKSSEATVISGSLDGIEIPETTKALAATIIIVVLTIVVLNVLADVMLNKKRKGDLEFSPDDFANAGSLAAKLVTDQNNLSRFLRSQFHSETMEILRGCKDEQPASDVIRQTIAQALNEVIKGPSRLYELHGVNDIALMKLAKRLGPATMSGEGLAFMNRAVLEHAFQNELESQETIARPIIKEIRVAFGSRQFRLTLTKGAFFVCLAMSNILAPKLLGISFLVFNGGALAYAFSFMLVDTVAETEGRTASRQLWLSGVCTYLVVAVLVGLAVWKFVPGIENPELHNQLNKLCQPVNQDCMKVAEAFDTLFRGGVLRFILASFCSFAVAQYLDIGFFLFLKRIFPPHKMLWLRSNLSTFVAQAVDTIIFVMIGFGFPSLPMLVTLVIGQLGMKWIFSVAYTPLLYLAVWWIERGEMSSPSRRLTPVM